MKPKNRLFSLPAILVLSTLSTTGISQAAKTWSGTTDGNWATTTNWVEGALPGTNETLNLNASSAANLTITLGANRTVRGISLTSPSGPVTFTGSTLTLSDGGINMASATQNLTIASAVTYAASAQKWDVASAQSVTATSTFVRAPETPATVRFGTTGTIKLGAAAIPVLVDAQANPYATFGTDNWAATDATGKVVASAYTTFNASIGATFPSLPLDVTASFTQTGNGGSPGIRFADSVTAQTLTFASSTTFTGRGVLVTSTCAGGSITGGFLRPNRSSGGTVRVMNIIQNSPNDFTIGSNLTNSSASTAALLKSGTGKLILTVNNGYTAGSNIQEGILQLGNGGNTGMFGTGNVVNNAEIILNRNDTYNTLIHNISGTGSLTQSGSGEATLTTSVSTFTGPVNINAGTLGVTLMSNLGSGTAININGGTFKFYGAIDPSVRTITIGSSGATFNTNSQDITFANAIGNSGTGDLTKTGAGTLTLTQPAGYSGNTVVNAGTLLVNNTTGSGTSGSVTLNAGLGGTGTIAGAVTTTSTAVISPGSGGVGTLTVGGLTLESGSATNLEFGSGNDLVNVTTADGLVLNGGTINLYENGTGLTTAFAGTPGTYNLFQYTGTLGGSVTNLSVGNPLAGKSYTFGTSGGYVTLTIADTGVNRNWVTNGDGGWDTAANWNGSVPDFSQSVVNFTTNLTAPSTVSLNGSKTIGAAIFTSSPNGYTIAQGSGGSLILANAGSIATISINAGTHTISAPVTLSDSLEVSAALLGRSLTLSGIVSGTGKGITKTGLGDLNLLGANTFTGDISLTGGSTSFATGGLGAGNITLDGMRLVWDGANTEDITSSGRLVYMPSNPVTFDTNGNDVLIAGPLGEGGSSALVKQGTGKLTLSADNTYVGGTTVNNGELQLGAGGTSGSVIGNIVNNTQITVDRSDTTTLANTISGTGTLSKVGSNELILSGNNTYSGETFLTAGTLTIGSTNALQGSKLDYTTGTLQFGAVTTATIGGFVGSTNLPLVNSSAAAVALTAGGQNNTGTYSGEFSGAGSFTKVGTGTLLLTGASTHTGGTNVNGGAIEIDSGGSLTGGAANVTGNSRLTLFSGSITASAASNISNAASTAPLFDLIGGTATYSAGLNATGNGNGNALIRVGTGAVLSASSMTLGRTAQSVTAEPTVGSITQGLFVNGGVATVTGDLLMGNGTGSNSSVNVRMDSGSLSVGGAITVGLSNGGRWSILHNNGGTLTSTDTVTGVSLGGALVGNAAFLVSGGTTTVERIQFGQAANTGTSIINLSGGSLYLGSGGLVIGSSDVGFVSQLKLNGGTLGAKADWSSPAAVAIPTTGAVTIKAADAADVPHDITLAAALTGTASLTKSGAGTLTLNGANTYTGATNVNVGTLTLSTDDVLSDTALVNVATGATLNLTHSGTDTILNFQINGVDQGSGTFGGTGSGADHIVSAITGTGKLYVIPTDPFLPWIAGFGYTGADALPGSDPDGDGQNNLLEFALNSAPNSAASSGKIRASVELVSGDNALTYTLPVRTGAAFTGSTSQTATIDGVTYTIEGSDDLSVWNTMVISEVTPALSAGLPALDTGWTYRTFRTPGTASSDPSDFIRSKVHN